MKAIRQWAYNNALTLVFVMTMFILTWIWILAVVVFWGGGIR